jgi:hypothetical protein
MSNVLTALLPTMFKTVPMVMREQVGFIPAVSRDFTPEQMNLAVGQTMTIPLSVSQALADYSPAMSTSAGTDKTPTTTTLTISRNKSSSFHLTHEEKQILINGGTLPGYREQQIAECFRSICNLIEQDVGSALDAKFSRAVGSAGTNPFASNLANAASLKRMLKDNGAWVPGQMSCVIDTAAEEALGGLTQLTNVNQAGSDDLLRNGVISRLQGFDFRVSSGIGIHTSGTAASATLTATDKAVGSINLATAAAGTGTILTGDVISLANDTGNKYGVITGVADVSSASTAMYIGAPGLRKATGAVARAITVTGDHTSNFAFNRNAVLLFARPPIIERTPVLDTISVTDPVSGLTFLVCEILGDGMTTYRVNLAWGVSVIKPEAVVKLIG